MKLVLKFLGGAVILCLLGFFMLLWMYSDIPASDLEEKYASSPSKFVEVDGVRYHVRQEGDGPDVLLLHASFGNMFMWDGWVENLSDQYRITRIDLIAHGLTGPGSEDSYSTDDLAVSLHALLGELQLEDFHLVGTSIGGILAFTYAADYEDQVRSLTLINSAGLIHRTVNPNAVQEGIPLIIRLFSRITPKYRIDELVTGLISSEDKTTDKVLQTYYDMIMRDGNRQAILNGMRNYKSRDPSPWLKEIVAPTFVIWSGRSVLPAEEADEFIALLENTHTQIQMIEEGGHALPISHPIITSEAAAEFWSQVDEGAFSDSSAPLSRLPQ